MDGWKVERKESNQWKRFHLYKEAQDFWGSTILLHLPFTVWEDKSMSQVSGIHKPCLFWSDCHLQFTDCDSDCEFLMLKVTHIHDQLFDSLPVEETCFFSHYCAAFCAVLISSHECPSCFWFILDPVQICLSLLPPSALRSHQPDRHTGILTRTNVRKTSLHNHSVGRPTSHCSQPRFWSSRLWRLMYSCFVCLMKVWHEAPSKSPSGQPHPVCSDDWLYCAVCLLGQGDVGR